jgi:hypothetical protein
VKKTTVAPVQLIAARFATPFKTKRSPRTKHFGPPIQKEFLYADAEVSIKTLKKM